MKLHLASFDSISGKCRRDGETEEEMRERISSVYLLTSFWEIFGRYKRGYIPFWVYQQRHMLDSGAFSFMQGSGLQKDVDWDAYIDQYIGCIKETNQQYFFELDIDVCVGLKKVEEYRDKIEQAVGRATIPVWHKSRGKEYWLRLVEEYDYVSIGGIVAGEIKRTDYKYLPWFLETARKNNCKVHALGFTGFADIHKYPFYSVDSTSWLSGGRFFGGVYTTKINKYGQRILTKRDVGDDMRCKKTADMHLLNFEVWASYQKYAEKYL